MFSLLKKVYWFLGDDDLALQIRLIILLTWKEGHRFLFY